MLLTRSPLRSSVLLQNSSFDLHVLSTPPAFILSQDQTLRKKISLFRVLSYGFKKRQGLSYSSYHFSVVKVPSPSGLHPHHVGLSISFERQIYRCFFQHRLVRIKACFCVSDATALLVIIDLSGGRNRFFLTGLPIICIPVFLSRYFG